MCLFNLFLTSNNVNKLTVCIKIRNLKIWLAICLVKWMKRSQEIRDTRNNCAQILDFHNTEDLAITLKFRPQDMHCSCIKQLALSVSLDKFFRLLKLKYTDTQLTLGSAVAIHLSFHCLVRKEKYCSDSNLLMQ